jgi:hypothetical protein
MPISRDPNTLLNPRSAVIKKPVPSASIRSFMEMKFAICPAPIPSTANVLIFGSLAHSQMKALTRLFVPLAAKKPSRLPLSPMRAQLLNQLGAVLTLSAHRRALCYPQDRCVSFPLVNRTLLAKFWLRFRNHQTLRSVRALSQILVSVLMTAIFHARSS